MKRVETEAGWAVRERVGARKHRFRRLPWLLAFPLSLAACLGTETGNPSATAGAAEQRPASSETRAGSSLVYTLLPSPAVQLPATFSAAGLVITQAWIHLGESRFEDPQGCAQAASEGIVARSAAPVLRDLVQGNAASSLMVSGAMTCGLRLQLSRFTAPPPGAPAETLGASLLLVAEVNGVRLLYRSLFEGALVVAADAPWTLASPPGVLVVAWDLQRLLGTALPEAAGGVLLGIDDTSLLESTALYLDGNENGLLEGEERSRALARGRLLVRP